MNPEQAPQGPLAPGQLWRTAFGRRVEILGRYADGQWIGLDRETNTEMFFLANGQRWFRPDASNDLVARVR